jgi:hypothetical protein
MYDPATNTIMLRDEEELNENVNAKQQIAYERIDCYDSQ